MNSILKQALPTYSTPDQAISGFISYIEKHAQTSRKVYSELTSTLVNGQWESSYGDSQVIALSTGNDISGVGQTFTTLGNIRTAIAEYMDADVEDAQPASEPMVVVTTVRDGATQTTNRTLSNVMDVIGEGNDMTGILISTMQSMRQCITQQASDFYSLIKENLSHVSIRDNLRENLLSSINDIKMTYGNLGWNNILVFSPQILSLFGISSDPATAGSETISTYSGVNALTALSNDFIQSAVGIATTLPQWISNTAKILLYAIYQCFSTVTNIASDWITDKVLQLLSAQDAFTCVNEEGDGSLSIDYSYRFPKSAGSWQNVMLANIFSNLEVGTVQAFLPTGSIIVADHSNYYDLTYIPRLFSYSKVKTALRSINTTSNLNLDNWLPWIPNNSMSIKRNPDWVGDPQFVVVLDRSEVQTVDILNTIFKDNDCLLHPAHCQDTEFFMSILTTQLLTGVLGVMYELALSDTAWDSKNLERALLSASASLQYDIIDNMIGASTSLDVTNELCALTAASMQSSNTAFSCSAAQTLTRSGNYVTIDTTKSCSVLAAFCYIAGSCYIETSVPDGEGLFLPYTTRVVQPVYSWGIPSDQENYEAMAGLFKRGIITLGVIAIAIVTFVVFKKLRLASYALTAQAGDLSWKAASLNDSAMMKQSWKLSRRATLLGKLTGTASSIATQNAISLNSNEAIENKIKAVGQLIKPNFD